MPVSSSRLMNVIPPAVAGRCRWVTMPPTRTRRPCSTSRQPRRSAPRRPCRGAPRTNWAGWLSGRQAGGPDVGHHRPRPRPCRAAPARAIAGGRAGQPVGPLLRRRARPPTAPRAGVQAEAGERVGGGQRLQLRRWLRCRPGGPGRRMSRYGPSVARSSSMRSARSSPIVRTSDSPSRTTGPPSPHSCGGSRVRSRPAGVTWAAPGRPWRRWR